MDAKTQQKYARAIRPLLATKGWEYLSDILTTQRTTLVDLLIKEVDQTLITNYQGQILGIDKLFKEIEFYGETVKVNGRTEEEEE
jgi:hypothetical protein